MDIKAIFEVVKKGVSVATEVWENRDLALKAISAVQSLVEKKNVTKADIDATEADLDAMLDEFNADLPPE